MAKKKKAAAELKIERPPRAKLTAEEALKRMEEFPKRKEKIVAAVRASNGSKPHALESRFKKLTKTWKEEAAHLGTPARMSKHPAYQEIIRMGATAIPFLLAELRREPDFWFAALRAITGEDPVPEPSAGKIDEMRHAWLEWGRARGLIK